MAWPTRSGDDRRSERETATNWGRGRLFLRVLLLLVLLVGLTFHGARFDVAATAAKGSDLLLLLLYSLPTLPLPCVERERERER